MKLVRHTAYNLIGLGVPLIVAVFSIPVLIAYLGEARFGLLTLIWAVVSYFGLFDLGFGRALTQQLSALLARGETDQVAPLVGTAIGVMAALGLFAGVLMAAIAPWGVGLIQSIPDRQEAIQAIFAMSLAMPAIVLTSGFRGILEARHAFGLINLMRLPMGLLTFVGPLVVVLYWEPRLDLIAFVLMLGRVLACVAHGLCAWQVLPKAGRRLRWQSSLLRPLGVSGGWLTLGNIVAPLMGYVDRFFIGAAISAAAVAYYATPHELVTKLWIIPGALTTVLFPTFAANLTRSGADAWQLFDRSVEVLFWTLLPITAVLFVFSKELLSMWISPAFAVHSGPLLKVFAVGIFINCLAHVPNTWLQAAGHFRTTSVVQCVALPLFIAALWVLVENFGLLGASIAWCVRIVLDAGVIFLLCYRAGGRSISGLALSRCAAMGSIAAGAFALALITDPVVRAGLLFCLAAAAAAVLLRAWRGSGPLSLGVA